MTDGGSIVASGTPPVPRPPSDLAASGKRLWREVHEEWQLGPHEAKLLLEACRTVDELDSLRAAIRESSALVEGSRGQPRAHPAFEEVRRHREQLARLVTALRLPADEVSAPPSVASARAAKAAEARWSREQAKQAKAAQAKRRG